MCCFLAGADGVKAAAPKNALFQAGYKLVLIGGPDQDASEAATGAYGWTSILVRADSVII